MKPKILSLIVCLTALGGFLPLQAGPALFDGYFAVSKALAEDSLTGAKSASTDLVAAAKAEGQAVIAEKAAALAQSSSLDQARAGFKPLSAEIIKLAEGKPGFHVMTCSMAGGDWLQADTTVANPYMGKAMLRCGGAKGAH